MSADLQHLNPYVKQQADKLVANANKRIKSGKYEVRFVQGFRSIEEQNKLYAQGRNGDTQPKVTNAKGGQSMHNFGLAVDFALFTLDGKKVSWDTKTDFDKDGQADWLEVVEEAKALGFEWGGDWKTFKDMPHFQMLGGLTESEIRQGKVPTFGVHAPAKKQVTTAVKKFSSLVDYLVAHKLPHDYQHRFHLAEKHGVKSYTGSAEQNIKLLNTLQK